MKTGKAIVRLTPAAPRADRTLPEAFEDLLRHLGEDPTREGLVKTPERAEKALRFLTSGYRMDLDQIVHGALFDVPHDEMILVKEIEFFSLCEHHLLPFYGKMHVAYLPKNRIIGLSKIPRIVDLFSRRLQVQERLTTQVAEAIRDIVRPRGVGVICEARHFCMMMRGVEKQHSGTVTSAMLGAFRSSRATREEFLALVAHSSLGF